MAYDDPQRFDPFAVLSKSFRVGHPFGIELRVFVTSFFVVLLGVSEFSKWPGVGFLLALSLGLASAMVLYLIVFVHELGHVFVGRRYGIHTPTITLSAMGGLAHMGAPCPSPGSEIKVALGGPATHLLWLAVAWPLSRVVPPLELGTYQLRLDVFGWLVKLNLALLLFNLLPAFPMDGGRAFRAALATRMHPNRATLIACRVGIVCAIGIGAWGLKIGGFSHFQGAMLIIIAINNTLACMREMVAARHSEGPYAPVDSWSADGEEWKRGVTPERHAEIASEVLGLPPQPRRNAGRTSDDDEELDRLLDRVRDVGIAGLSDTERRRLTELSVLRGGGARK